MSGTRNADTVPRLEEGVCLGCYSCTRVINLGYRLQIRHVGDLVKHRHSQRVQQHQNASANGLPFFTCRCSSPRSIFGFTEGDILSGGRPLKAERIESNDCEGL